MSELSAELIKQSLGYEYDISVYESLDSTNAEARRVADSKSNSVIIADYQTSGRGRLGRQFYSPKGRGLYMSFLLDYNSGTGQSVLVTTAVSVAVCRAIKAASGIDAGIKWVNDLYLGGRKICGILCESVIDYKTSGIKQLIIGIGINCDGDSFPEDIRDTAGSLGGVDRNRLAAEIIRNMSGIYDMISERSFLDEYRQRSVVLGREIKVINTSETAKAIGIDDMGGLVIQVGEEIKTLSSGEISIRLCGNNKVK